MLLGAKSARSVRPSTEKSSERDATALDVLHDGERARDGDGIEHHGDLQCAG
jgi:hypothetical protein